MLSNPKLEIKYASPSSGPAPILNALLGLKGEEDEVLPQHECMDLIHLDTSPRSDMSSTALPNAQNVSVDDSCLRPSDTTYHAGYAVVQLPDVILEANSVPFQSAQAAELIVLTRACQLFAEQDVNIYTDSKYAFSAAHDFGVICKRRGSHPIPPTEFRNSRENE